MKQINQLPENMKMILASESGRVGYLIAWMLGVPVSVLFILFLIRGH